MSTHPELPERDRRILGVARPGATSTTASRSRRCGWPSRGFGVSSATLRNILARLEEQGYVRQPHTSAGRVPTDLGYRCYVDQLLAERRSSRPAPQVEARLRRAGTVDDLLSHVSQEVSRASHQVGFAIAPGGRHDDARAPRLRAARRRQGPGRASSPTGGHVSHKVIEPTERLRPDELQQAANYLNSEFKGRSLLDGAAGRAASGCARSAGSTTS